MLPDLTFLDTLAARVAEVQLRYFRGLRAGDIERKGSHRDLLTVADTESERVIVESIRQAFPGHAILAEEAADDLSPTENDNWWVIDPIDGTTNFARGFPFFAASVAFWHKGEPLLALVEAPALGERFTAARGQGAFLNGRPIRVSAAPDIRHSLLATGFAYVRNEVESNNLDNFSRLILKCHDIRRPGAASLDLAYVAAGRFDGFWEPYLKPWDVAAGALLVREAGGQVSDFGGGGDWLFGENIAASNGAIHAELLSELTGLDEGYRPWGRDIEPWLRG